METIGDKLHIKRTPRVEELEHFFEYLKKNPARLSGTFEETYREVYWYKFRSISSRNQAIGVERSREYNTSIREQNRLKAVEMRRLYDSGKTLEEVGEVFNITRERVRQILYSYFSDFVARKQTNYDAGYKKICGHCKKEFKTSQRDSKYCSRACSNLGRRIYRSPEEIREGTARRVREYYHRVLKHKPDFKQKVKEQNDKYQKTLKDRLSNK